MAYEAPLRIVDIIKNIDKGTYVLPSIQREFVWSTDQIETLFDSIMQEYPIGSFLFWKVDKENYNQYEFYSFLRNYHEKNHKHNPKANLHSESNITAILDGQQRLTSIFIGLKGTYAYRLKYKNKDNEDAYPKRKLYLNLLGESSEYDRKYDFQFLTPDSIINNPEIDNENYWFEVGKIIEMTEMADVMEFLTNDIMFKDGYSKEKRKWATGVLSQLFQVIQNKEIISYYLEKSQDLDKVLNIFIRVNSGGTILSYSDLLLSIASAQWEEYDAREEIINFVDYINEIGNGFNINKDFVLKSSLILSDFKNIAFKANNFNKRNMLEIESNWEEIKNALSLSFQLISSFGYSKSTLKSNNAIIPIAYYLLKIGLPKNYITSSKTITDRISIKKWLNRSLVKKVFSGQPDNVLRQIREIIRNNNNGFPYNEILNKFRGTNKTIVFTEEDIEENILQLQYSKSDTLPSLMFIYPGFDQSMSIHVDHIYPKSLFTRRQLEKRGLDNEDIQYYMDNVNGIANLQLLMKIPNIEKQNKEFKHWLNETYPSKEAENSYMDLHYIPDVNFDFTNFNEFYESRKEKLKQAFINELI